MVAVDPGNRRLAGRINLGDDHRVGVVEAGTNSSNSDCSRGEAMRLHHRMILPLLEFTRRLQHRRDLNGMMS